MRESINENEPHLIIFNNPNNPSGCVYNKEEIKKLCVVFEEYNSYVMADDIYENIVHKNIY